MKKNTTNKPNDYELNEEYDLSQLPVIPQGRFDPKYRIGSNVVVLAPDIAEAFPDDKSVNEAFSLLLKASRLAQHSSI